MAQANLEWAQVTPLGFGFLHCLQGCTFLLIHLSCWERLCPTRKGPMGMCCYGTSMEMRKDCRITTGHEATIPVVNKPLAGEVKCYVFVSDLQPAGLEQINLHENWGIRKTELRFSSKITWGGLEDTNEQALRTPSSVLTMWLLKPSQITQT